MNHYINYKSLFLSALYGRNNGDLIKKLNKDFLNIAPITLLYGDTCSKDEQKRVASEIRKFYFDDGPIDNSTRFKVIDVSSHIRWKKLKFYIVLLLLLSFTFVDRDRWRMEVSTYIYIFPLRVEGHWSRFDLK